MADRVICVGLSKWPKSERYPTNEEILEVFQRFGEVEAIMARPEYNHYFLVIFKEDSAGYECRENSDMPNLLSQLGTGCIIQHPYEVLESLVVSGDPADFDRASLMDLNDDCLSHILSLLPKSEWIPLELTCRRLERVCAREWRKVKHVRLTSSYLCETKTSLLYSIFRSGSAMTALTIACLGWSIKDALLLAQLVCPNLKYLCLRRVALNAKMLSLFAPLFTNLTDLVLDCSERIMRQVLKNPGKILNISHLMPLLVVDEVDGDVKILVENIDSDISNPELVDKLRDIFSRCGSVTNIALGNGDQYKSAVIFFSKPDEASWAIRDINRLKIGRTDVSISAPPIYLVNSSLNMSAYPGGRKIDFTPVLCPIVSLTTLNMPYSELYVADILSRMPSLKTLSCRPKLRFPNGSSTESFPASHNLENLAIGSNEDNGEIVFGPIMRKLAETCRSIRNLRICAPLVENNGSELVCENLVLFPNLEGLHIDLCITEQELSSIKNIFRDKLKIFIVDAFILIAPNACLYILQQFKKLEVLWCYEKFRSSFFHNFQTEVNTREYTNAVDEILSKYASTGIFSPSSIFYMELEFYSNNLKYSAKENRLYTIEYS